MTASRMEAEGHPVVLAFGGSAGSVQPLIEIVRDLPTDLQAAVLVTIHIGEQTRLPQILSRSGRLKASQAGDGGMLEPGRIYIAPPGVHLIVRDGFALLSPGPRVNRHRPAVDVMFASTAEWVAERAIAVVLSGALDDGAVGAALIDRAGGQVLAQDPTEAEFTGMPRSALAAAPRARPVSVRELAKKICDAVDAAHFLPRSDRVAYEARMGGDMDMIDSDDPAFLREDESRLTRLTCPECGGGMAQVDLPQISYFRCHVGHQFAPQTLVAAQAEASEKKLWSAVAALEEQASVLRYIHRGTPTPDQTGSPEQARADQAGAGRDRHAEEIASRAAALRAQVREWSNHPPEVETKID